MDVGGIRCLVLVLRGGEGAGLALGKSESGEMFIRHFPARLTFPLGYGLAFLEILSYILLLTYLTGLTARLCCINEFLLYTICILLSSRFRCLYLICIVYSFYTI